MSVIYFIFQQTMYFMIPLMIVALGAMFSERSGIINIALEGIMTMGAFTGILFSQMQLILAVLISMATGMFFSLFHGYASINMKANQVISGTALNMFAPAFAIFVARVIQGVQQVQFTNTFRITSVPILGRIPFIGPLLFQNAYITTYIGIAIFVLSTVVQDAVWTTPALLRRASPGGRRGGHQRLPYAVRGCPDLRSSRRLRRTGIRRSDLHQL